MADTAELIVALKLQDGVSSGLGRLNGQLKGMQGGLSQVGKGIGQVGRGLDTALTRGAIAAAAGLGAVISTAASFEQAFTGVEKTVGGTDAQLAELEGTLRGMARTMPVSFEELSAIGEAGGALGIARESLDEFVDVVARLAVSTDLSSEQAATSLGQLGTILHLSGGEYEEFADSLVGLGNAGASTESQIVELAARFAAAGNSAGLSKEEILAISSAVASMGVDVEAGGTALSNTFNNIATGIGTGAKEIDAFTDTLGISAGEFKRRWTEDALGTFTDFLTELSKLDQYEQAAVLEDAGITGARQLNAVKLMTQNLGFFSDQLTVAQDSQGALDKESGKFFDTAQSQWKILQNNVRDAAATIGTEVLPVTKEVLEDLTAALADPANQARLKEFGQSLASGIREFVAEIKAADFGPLIDTMKGAAAVAKGAFDAFRSLPAPIQQLALAALVANKVSGGAVGQIAGGLANILAGSLKVALSLRGSSPANPLWVQSVGGGLGGGPGGLGRGRTPFGGGFGGPGGLGGLATQFLKLGLPVIAGVVAFELGKALASGNFRMPWDQAPTKVLAPGFAPKPGADAAGADTVLLQNFGDKLSKLATNDVLMQLGRTTEIGLKDVGTTFQVGIKTGNDAVGDFATRILARAENPTDPAVLTEINGHIAGLEQIQAQYLATGDVRLATMVQANLDTLYGIKGALDLDRAVTQYQADRAVSSDAAMLATAQFQSSKLDTTNAQLGVIAARNPVINVNIALSPTVIQQRISQIRTLSGSGGFI